MNADLNELLKKELETLKKAENILKHSFDQCTDIEIKESFSLEEMDLLESLTARFARLSDILIQKILRLIDEIELEGSGTVRDRINKAEKKEAIFSAEKMIEIRMLRNLIAHEYLPEEINHIFGKVLTLTPELLKNCDLAKQYAQTMLNK